MANSESTRIHLSVPRQPKRERRAVIVAPEDAMDAITEAQRLAKSGIIQMVFFHGQEQLAQRWLENPPEVGLMVLSDQLFKIESAPMTA